MACGGAAVLLLCWLSTRETAGAIEQWPSQPARALARLERAAYNPLDEQPLVQSAKLRLDSGQLRSAAADLTLALRRNPESWLASFERGLIAQRRAVGERRAST